MRIINRFKDLQEILDTMSDHMGNSKKKKTIKKKNQVEVPGRRNVKREIQTSLDGINSMPSNAAEKLVRLKKGGSSSPT